MSEPRQISQSVKESQYAATSATGDASVYIYNYYGYREEVRVEPVKAGETATGVQLPSPYRGLFHFSPEDAEFFFGRDAFVEELFETAQTRNFIPVLGASGSGKSSVVLAGLVPRLQQAGHWLFTHFRPGADPFQSLAEALVPLYTSANETLQIAQARLLATYFREDKATLTDIFSHIQRRHPQQRVLLIADQFEELYTLCPEPQLRQSFLDTLLAGFQSHSGKSHVLMATLRADFLGNALSYPKLGEVLRNADVKIRSMNREELSEVIVKPAEKLKVVFQDGLVERILKDKVVFQDGLVERILKDVEDEPGNLPLLEFALTELWQRRQGKQLTHTAYEEIGGVQGALARHADQSYHNLSSTGQEQMRRIFIQLVRPGEGTEDTRRLATKDELGEAKWSLVQLLANERLVVTSRNAAEQETVEVVHEALIGKWSQLRAWMTKDRLFRTWQERLRAGMHQWEGTKRDEGALLRGVPLIEAEEQLKDRRDELGPPEQEFIQQSVKLQERQRQEEEKRQLQELETARKIAEQERRTRKAAQTRTRVTVGASVIILGFAIFAGYQWRQAEIQQIQALLETSEANLNSNQGLEARVASLSAAKILKRSWWQALLPEIGLKNQVLGELYQTINNAGGELNRLEGHQGLVTGVVFSPDGKLLATSGLDRMARLWDMSGKPLAVLKGHQSQVNNVVFSPDGKLLATSGVDGTARLWDTSGKPLAVLKGDQGLVYSVVFSPDGKLLATSGLDGTARLWNTSGKPLAVLKGHQGLVTGVVFSPDGKLLATSGQDGTVRLWDMSGKPLAVLKSHQVAVNNVVFSPDGKLLATSGQDGTARLWQVGRLDQLLVVSCDWVLGYLKTNPKVNDHTLCDGIGTQK